MTLQDYTRRAAEDRGETFRDGPSAVTVLAYFFRDAASYDAKFVHLAGAILETWRHCGRMKTVVVTNRIGAALAKFAARYPWVEVQVEPSLVPGDIDSMSRDCLARLGERFATDYVLVVQDDGFPLRGGLEPFVALGYDFIGAPFCRDLWWPRLLTRLLRFAPMNGGFSLRSRRGCRVVADYWRRHYAGQPFRADFIEDNFYTNYLPRRHLGAWLRLRPCPCDIAARFSHDGSFPLNVRRGLPLGFHNARAFEALSRAFGIEGRHG